MRRVAAILIGVVPVGLQVGAEERRAGAPPSFLATEPALPSAGPSLDPLAFTVGAVPGRFAPGARAMPALGAERAELSSGEAVTLEAPLSVTISDAPTILSKKTGEAATTIPRFALTYGERVSVSSRDGAEINVSPTSGLSFGPYAGADGAKYAAASVSTRALIDTARVGGYAALELPAGLTARAAATRGLGRDTGAFDLSLAKSFTIADGLEFRIGPELRTGQIGAFGASSALSTAPSRGYVIAPGASADLDIKLGDKTTLGIFGDYSRVGSGDLRDRSGAPIKSQLGAGLTLQRKIMGD